MNYFWDKSRAMTRGSLVVGGLLMAMGGITVAQGWIYTRNLEESIRCQADFNTQVSAVLIDRSELAIEDRANIAELVAKVGMIDFNDRAEFETALQTYLRRKDAIDEQREPIPQIEEVHSCD